VDGEIDPAVAERLLDLLGEQALAAGLRQRPVLDGIAGGLDDGDGDALRRPAEGGGQRIAHRMGLPQGQRAAAGADGKARGG